MTVGPLEGDTEGAEGIEVGVVVGLVEGLAETQIAPIVVPDGTAP